MVIEVREPNPDDRPVILNLGTYFRYDLLPFIEDGIGSKLNRFGTIGDEVATTHRQSDAEEKIWWTKPGILLPMLIRVDREPAGFAQVARPPHAHRSVDYRMEDFFIVNKFRRAGVGGSAVAEIFNRYPGWWEIGWVPKNMAAEAFWRAATRQWWPEDWLVPQAPGTPGLPGLRFLVRRT
jgi:aminoglycoside 6'-N-acetyltransferase I